MRLLFLDFYGTKSVEDVVLKIGQSKLGQIYIKDANATLDDCSSIQSRISENKTFVVAMESILILTSLHTKHFYGGSFLQAFSGTVEMTNVKFVKSVVFYSLISVTDQSILQIVNSSFISNSAFRYNSSMTISAEGESSLIEVSKSRVHLAHCIFIRNTFPLSSSIVHSSESSGFVEKCKYLSNNGSGVYATDAIGKYNPQFYKIPNEFTGDNINNDMERIFNRSLGSPLKWVIVQCTFVENTAGNGGAIFAGNISLYLLRNNFTSNSAVDFKFPFGVQSHGGAICLAMSSTLVEDCLFLGTRLPVVGQFQHKEDHC